MEILYAAETAHNKKSENITLRLCLHYVTRPSCISESVCRILQQSLAQWYLLLKNQAMYLECDTRSQKFIKLLKLQEKLHCKVYIASSICSIVAYSKIFQDIVFQIGRTKDTLVVKVSPRLALLWLASEKKCYNLEF